MSSVAKNRHSVEELISMVSPLAKRYGVGKVYLFGSVARGDSDENSDYDFCIEMGKIRDLFVLSEFFQDLRDAIGSEIDLVDTKSISTEMLNVIRSEGVVVYEG